MRSIGNVWTCAATVRFDVPATTSGTSIALTLVAARPWERSDALAPATRNTDPYLVGGAPDDLLPGRVRTPATRHRPVRRKSPAPQQGASPSFRGSHPAPHPHDAGPSRSGEAPAAVAEKARTVLKYVDEHHEAPTGYEGGRTFHNGGGAGDQALPKHDDRGRAIAYQDWDVNPKVEGVNRGTERLVTGSDGSAYITAAHYRTFTKIR